MNAREYLRRLERERPDIARARRALEPRMVVARNVHRLRNERGLTQKALAERAVMSQPRIAEIENADVTPRIDTLFRIAEALDVPPAALVGGDDPQVMRVVLPEKGTLAPRQGATPRIVLLGLLQDWNDTSGDWPGRADVTDVDPAQPLPMAG